MAKTKRSTGKPSRSTRPRFYTPRSLQKAADNWMETVKDYKVVNRFFDDGKDFVEDVRWDVRRTIDDLIDSGKDLFKSARKDTRYIINEIFDNGKRFMDKVV
jgi:hypothetical protein